MPRPVVLMMKTKAPAQPAGCLSGEVLVNGVCRIPAPKEPAQPCASGLPVEPGAACSVVVAPPFAAGPTPDAACPLTSLWLVFSFLAAWVCQ